MNTNTIKTVGLYLAGAVIGGAIGAVIGSLIVDSILARENGGMETYEEEGPEGEEEEKPLLTPKVTIVEKPVEKKQVSYEKFSKGPEANKSLKQLASLARQYTGEAEEEKDVDHNLPHVITLQEWTETGLSNHKATLSYYELDDVLADGNDGIVSDPDQVLGPDALLKFGVGSEDKDVVYVRNNKISTDFEIIRLHRSYSEEVAGIVEEKKKPRKVKQMDDDEE